MASSRRWAGLLVAAGVLSSVSVSLSGQVLPVEAQVYVLAASMSHGGTHVPGQGYLGIDIRDVSESEVVALRLKSSRGAEIIMVDHDGPAGKAGLREHDVVLSVNGTLVDGEDQLRKLLHDMQPGRAVAMLVCRNGAEQTVNATMANRAELERQAWENHWTVPEPAFEDSYPSSVGNARGGPGRGFIAGHLLPLAPAYTGAIVDALDGQLADYFGVREGRGLLVHEVEGNSPAAAAGLHAGDVVTRINGDRVGSKSDWGRALHDSKGHPVSLTIVRDRREQTLTMVPDGKHHSQLEPPVEPPLNRSRLSVLLLR